MLHWLLLLRGRLDFICVCTCALLLLLYRYFSNFVLLAFDYHINLFPQRLGLQANKLGKAYSDL